MSFDDFFRSGVLSHQEMDSGSVDSEPVRSGHSRVAPSKVRSAQRATLRPKALIAASALSLGLMAGDVLNREIFPADQTLRSPTGTTSHQVMVVKRTEPDALMKKAIEIWNRPKGERRSTEDLSALLDKITASLRG